MFECSMYFLGVCVLGKGEASSIFRRRSVWLKILRSIHIKAESEKHMQPVMKRYSIRMIVFQSMISLNPTKHSHSTHCKLISHLKKNKGIGGDDVSFMSHQP